MKERVGLRAAAVQAFLERHVAELAISAVAAAIATAVWAFISAEWGAVLLAAVPIGAALAIAYAEGAYREQLRQERAAELERADEERREMRRIADMARELLLEATIWRDTTDLRGRFEAERADPSRERAPLPEWSPVAILGRGREVLDPSDVRGWQDMADSLRYHAEHLTRLIDQEFPGPPAERRAELSSVFRAAAKAAEAADLIAAARSRATSLTWGGTPEEKRAAADQLRGLGHGFYGALEWMEGSIARIDESGEVERAIDAKKAVHLAAWAVTSRVQRELQSIASSTAEQLLTAAAPAPAYLERSTIGRSDATLRDIAAASSFAFAPSDEVAALEDWRDRLQKAQRAFQDAVVGRGGDMHGRTHWHWVRVANDAITGLENAVGALETDCAQRDVVAAASDSIVADVVERSREGVQTAVRRFVALVAELRAVDVG